MLVNVGVLLCVYVCEVVRVDIRVYVCVCVGAYIVGYMCTKKTTNTHAIARVYTHMTTGYNE